MIPVRAGLLALVLLALGLVQSAPPILVLADQVAARAADDRPASRTPEVAAPSAPLLDLALEVNGVELVLWGLASLLCFASAAALVGPRPQEAEEFFWVSVLLDLCVWAALRRSPAYGLALAAPERIAVLAALAAVVGVGFLVRAIGRAR